MPEAVKEHGGKRKKVQTDPSKMPLLLILGMLLLPGVLISVAAVSNPSVMPSDWEETLDWVKEHTPVTSYYNDPLQTPEYGVLSCGTLVIGSFTDPKGQWLPIISTAVQETAAFFLSQNETEASDILDERNVKYILTDISMVQG
jgi:dolichyl-diphosphooligosaccharide--protein glycosyltransferase